MIVTCDHCGARYKLDESRISGRGAKITCPRCRHVFVVYRDKEAEIEPAAKAIGGDRAEAAEAASPAPDASPAPAPVEETDYDVHALEFRKVGIPSWKVKVKIGLVYDFSDFKTLAKYISDGRVTESDKLSHDGQTWTPIGEIPDLEQHFVDVYKEAEAAMRAEAAADDGTEDYDDDAPTNIVGMDNLADSIGAEQAAAATGDASARQLAGGSNLASAMDDALRSGGADADAPPRFVDPFEARKKARAATKGKPGGRGAASGPPTGSGRRPNAGKSSGRSAPAPAPRPDEGRSRAGLWLVALLLVIGSGAGYWFWQQSQVTDGPTTTNVRPALKHTPPPQKDAAPAGGDDLPGEPVNPDEVKGEEPEDADPWGVGAEEPQKCVKQADGLFHCEDGTILDGKGKKSASKKPAASGGNGGTAPAQNGSASVGAKSARDHAADGNSALRRADYSAAVDAFRQARNKAPTNAEYAAKLGVALMRNGDAGSAANYLNDAAQKGYVDAHEYLGDISRDQGDSAGAISHYQNYLKNGGANPGRVQQKIDSVSSGG